MYLTYKAICVCGEGVQNGIGVAGRSWQRGGRQKNRGRLKGKKNQGFYVKKKEKASAAVQRLYLCFFPEINGVVCARACVRACFSCCCRMNFWMNDEFFCRDDEKFCWDE